MNKRELKTGELRSQIQNLSVLRGLPTLNLSQSLLLQRNLSSLIEIEKPIVQAEEILRAKIKELKETDTAAKIQINEDFKKLYEKTYEFEFESLGMKVFPQDINSRPGKKVQIGPGVFVEVSYVECLLDSIGYSVDLDVLK